MHDSWANKLKNLNSIQDGFASFYLYCPLLQGELCSNNNNKNKNKNKNKDKDKNKDHSIHIHW